MNDTLLCFENYWAIVKLSTPYLSVLQIFNYILICQIITLLCHTALAC